MAAAALSDGAAADQEEDGMPKEDPTKLERAPGEENEKVRACALFFTYEYRDYVVGDTAHICFVFSYGGRSRFHSIFGVL